ncbi:MAG: cohesin domain-containing protein, partial [Bacteroidota bacterium]
MKHIYTYLTPNSLLSGFNSFLKRTLLLFAVVLFGLSTRGQTTSELRILNSTSCVGDSVTVPVSVLGLQGAGAISFVVDYDQTSLSFVGINSFALTGIPIVNASGGEVRFSWADFSLGGSSLNDGILLNLRFV